MSDLAEPGHAERVQILSYRATAIQAFRVAFMLDIRSGTSPQEACASAANVLGQMAAEMTDVVSQRRDADALLWRTFKLARSLARAMVEQSRTNPRRWAQRFAAPPPRPAGPALKTGVAGEVATAEPQTIPPERGRRDDLIAELAQLVVAEARKRAQNPDGAAAAAALQAAILKEWEASRG